MREFAIDVPDSVLDDLQRRLRQTRWPDDLRGGDVHYGPDVPFMQALVRHWADQFDWRAHERTLNELPQLIADIRLQERVFTSIPSSRL